MGGDKAISLEEIKNETVDLVRNNPTTLALSLLSLLPSLRFPGTGI